MQRPSSPLSVLIIEDDENLRASIAGSLTSHGYQVSTACSSKEGLAQVQREQFDIVLTDLQLPEMDGINLIQKMRKLDSEADLVLMTAYGSSDIAIDALKAGAHDYISKPFSVDELLLTLRKIEQRRKSWCENAPLLAPGGLKPNFSSIIAESSSMKELFDTVKRLAMFNTTILITGESGTGKELLARAIHHNSPRRGKPFIAINCGAIPENLMESELFGHKKGSFTDATRDKRGLFEEAHGGTIFLDEIGELPLHLQVKLLRVLQEQQIRRVGDEELIPVDLRVVAATLRNLEEDIEMGRFREDLFYRLNVVSLHLPPLRERPEDIEVLAMHFLRKHSKSLGLHIKKINEEAMSRLKSYYWRGNVRELENCIERALVLCEGDAIDLDSLPDTIRNFSAMQRVKASSNSFDDGNLSIKQRTRSLEMDLIVRALEKTKGNRTHAAKILEISHRALLYKLKEYGISQNEK